jgi:N-acetylglucosamine-6-sulfatase
LFENYEAYVFVQTDPYQLNNLYVSNSNGTANTIITLARSIFSIYSLETCLDALLFILKTCKAKSCSEPWDTLLPNSGVATLADAMMPKYDQYFAELPRVAYSECAGGYIAEVEGPIWEEWMPDGSLGDLNGTHMYGRMGMGRGMLNRI